MKQLIYLVAFLCLQADVFAITKEEVRADFNRLLEITKTDTEVATNKLQNLAYQIQSTAEAAINTGTVHLARESNRLIEQVYIIEQSAAAEHVNVSSCTKSGRGILVELGEISQLTLDTCANRNSEQGIEQVSKALGQLRLITDQVFVLERRLEACASETCLSSLQEQIKFEEEDVPRRIEEAHRNALDKAEAFRLYLDICGLRAPEELLNHGAAVIADITKCVDRLIHPPTPASV